VTTVKPSGEELGELDALLAIVRADDKRGTCVGAKDHTNLSFAERPTQEGRLCVLLAEPVA